MNNSDAVQRLNDVIISPIATVAEAIARLDNAGTGALALCSDGKRLCGLLTDGDIRRAILRGIPLESACGDIATRNPVRAEPSITSADALHLMNQHDVNHLPVVGAEGDLRGFLLRNDLVVGDELELNVRSRLESVVISPTLTVAEAIARLDNAGTRALVLCSEGRRLYGLLTDGDIRRAILRGVPLECACGDIAIRNPVKAEPSITPVDALHMMNQNDIDHLLLVNGRGNVVSLLLRRDITGEEHMDLSAVIVAGGFGKRLLPLTEQVPKPMLPVGDRPLLELTIRQLRRCGIREVSVTTHYLPESILKHFGDGEAFGVKLRYLKEDRPLGTAGGLRLMKRTDKPLLVINGDILTGVPFHEMLNYHRRHRAEVTVGVRKYEMQVPFGTVECDDVRITKLQEKPSLVFFINAGMYLLEPSAWDDIPEGQRFDMTELIEKLLKAGRSVVSFPIMEYWLDVGRHEDYRQAQEDVRCGRI